MWYGHIIAEHYYQHQFVLNVHNKVEGTETYTNKLKELCDKKGYLKIKKTGSDKYFKYSIISKK